MDEILRCTTSHSDNQEECLYKVGKDSRFVGYINVCVVVAKGFILVYFAQIFKWWGLI